MSRLTVRINAVYAVSRSSKKIFVIFLHIPAGKADVCNTDKTHAFLTEQAIVSAHIDFVVERFYRQYAARQSLVGGEACVSRWNLHGEHTFGGGSPKLSAMVV